MSAVISETNLRSSRHSVLWCNICSDKAPSYTVDPTFRSSQRSWSIKKVFLKISQNSQQNTCAKVSFLIKLQASVCNFIEKEALEQIFPVTFCKIFKNTFFTERTFRKYIFVRSQSLREDTSINKVHECYFHNFLQCIQMKTIRLVFWILISKGIDRVTS